MKIPNTKRTIPATIFKILIIPGVITGVNMLEIIATALKNMRVERTAPRPNRITFLYPLFPSVTFAPKTPAQKTIVRGLEIVRMRAVRNAPDDFMASPLAEKLGIIEMSKPERKLNLLDFYSTY